MRMMIRMGLCMALLPWAGVRAAPATDAFDAMVAAERAFAADAKARGVNAAFLTAAGEHGVVFRPGPLRVADAYAAKPAATYSIDWTPAVAEIAGSGDLGYTVGPFVYTGNDDGTTHHGHYLTVWARDGVNAPFHFLSDIGVGHAAVPPPATVTRRGVTDANSVRLGRKARDARLTQLREIDSGVLARLRRESQAAVYASLGAPDLVVMREGALPMQLPLDDAALATTALGDAIHMSGSERISADGTLATTVASPAEGHGPSSVRVWRHAPADGWQLVVDVLLAGPVAVDATPVPATDVPAAIR